MKAVFLYSHLAGYFHQCIITLLETTPVKEVWVVSERADHTAPFSFKSYPGLTILYSDELTSKGLEEKLIAFNPDILYVSGWVNREYLRICGLFKQKNRPVVMGLDNQWKGLLRQQVGIYYFRWFLKQHISFAWVAGLYQYEFARKLGFDKSEIIYNLYSADTPLFSKGLELTLEQKNQAYPKVILFVGRFVPQKGIHDLILAFRTLNKDITAGWTLRLVGGGDISDLIQPEDHNIEIHPFTQPDQLPTLFQSSGVFCLASHWENWGVVIHEAATAGLPILASDACGAATAFVKIGYNGYTFKPGNVASLKKALSRIMATPSAELIQMSKRSAELSRQITPEIWAQTFAGLLQ